MKPIPTPVDVLRRGAEQLLDSLVPAAVAAVLRRIDLTALVIAHIDLEKVLATVDLSALVRASASDSVYRARVRAIAADDAVARLRERLLSHPERG